MVVFGLILPKIVFEIVIIFAKINDGVIDFAAVGVVPNYLGRIFVFDSQSSST